MRRPRGSLFTGIILTAFVVAQAYGVSTASAAPADRAQAAPVADELQITHDSADRVQGSFSRGASTVTFDGRRTSAVSASTVLTVNDKKVTATRDLKSGTATWTGGGATILPDDREALVSLVSALDRSWVEPTRDRKESLGGHRDLVVRLAMLVAEAPLGVRLDPQAAPRPGERTLDKKFTMTGAPAVESCLTDVIATTTAGTTDRRDAVIACQENNEDGILYFGDCQTFGRTICHDADGHCFLCETVNAGPASSECMGECGPGCNGLNIYTYDCGDHDQCGRVHGGSLNPWDAECGDEYFEADDDFLWGWPNC